MHKLFLYSHINISKAPYYFNYSRCRLFRPFIKISSLIARNPLHQTLFSNCWRITFASPFIPVEFNSNDHSDNYVSTCRMKGKVVGGSPAGALQCLLVFKCRTVRASEKKEQPSANTVCRNLLANIRILVSAIPRFAYAKHEGRHVYSVSWKFKMDTINIFNSVYEIWWILMFSDRQSNHVLSDHSYPRFIITFYEREIPLQH